MFRQTTQSCVFGRERIAVVIVATAIAMALLLGLGFYGVLGTAEAEPGNGNGYPQGRTYPTHGKGHLPGKSHVTISSWVDRDSASDPRDDDGDGTETTTVTYSVSNADGAEYAVDGGSWSTAPTSPFSTIVLPADGQPHVLQMRATKGSDGPVDSTPAEASLTICPQAGCGSTSPPSPSPPPAPSTSPFANEKLYVDPNSDAAITESQWRQQGRASDADYMHKIASQASDPVYFEEWTEDPTCCDGIAFYVRYYIDKAKEQGALPVMGAYAIPHRDCGSFSGGGFATAADYKAWIDEFAKAIIIYETDSLAGMGCLTSEQQQERFDLENYAVNSFKTNAPNAYVYMDGGHSKWQSATTMTDRLTKAGVANAQGFFTNNANFNYTSDEVAYGKQISSGIGAKHFIVDTSRNGLGVYPGGTHDGECPNWANPPGRALGERPTANTGCLRCRLRTVPASRSVGAGYEQRYLWLCCLRRSRASQESRLVASGQPTIEAYSKGRSRQATRGQGVNTLASLRPESP
jgi:endoglucanase